MTDLVIRPLTAGEAPLFESLADPGLVGFGAFGDRYGDRAARGEYRDEWTWIALHNGDVVARAAWWAGPDDDTPVALDWFDFTDFAAAVHLLRHAPLRAQAAGMTLLVERYRYRWTPECGMPPRPGRLRLRPEPDDAVILDVFRRIHQGSLDAHARRAIAASGLDARRPRGPRLAALDAQPTPLVAVGIHRRR